MEEIKIHTAGDSSVLIEFGQEISPEINAKITAFVHLMKAQHVEGVKDMIPAFTSLLINYDPRVVNYGALKERLEKLLKLEVSQETAPSRIFDIPVCYGGEYGPDLENIAMHANLSTQEVIDIHSSEDDSPGGWQLLGLTPVKTYDPNREIPILFEAGDYIHFVPVTEKDFLEIKEQVNQGTYECVIRQKGV